MSVRMRALGALAITALTALGAAGSALAQTSKRAEPLHQYVVGGGISAEDLARAGYDLNESGVKGRKGFAIVATASQAATLNAKKDVTVRALHRGQTAPQSAQRAPSATAPLPNPTHGYNVFRPWSLKPAPCPGTCATPLKPLKQIYQDIARRNPDVVK